MMPALQRSTSIGWPSFFTASMQARTEAGFESSQASGTMSPARSATADRAFSSVRPVARTRAPRIARTRTVSRPRPALQPVTRMVLPARSMPSVTSTAVDP